VTKPPILAWAALKLQETSPDVGFIREIYPALVRFNAWWLAMNDDDGDGLAQYNHPYSSGLDDSPLWDEGMPVESPDLNTYLHNQMICLGQIAEKIGMQNEAAMWRRRAASLVQRMIHDFWDPDAGLFWALKDEKPIRVVTPFNLLPLWTGSLPQPITSALVSHITNPAEFWGPYGLPTVARSDSKYDPETMWRGPVWANVNYFFIEALQRVGQTRAAAELREQTLNLVMGNDDIYEYYNPETGKPPPRAANIFGWTSAIFIDLAIQASRDAENEKSSG
jgi:glycogen debranching enzyme